MDHRVATGLDNGVLRSEPQPAHPRSGFESMTA